MMYENYEINENTLLIIPVSDEISKIYELNETFFISKSVKHIIDHSCKYFGSSYSGRYEGTKHLIGMNYKLPIIIEETKEIIFFPTCSPRQKECCWLSLSNIENYKSNGKKTKQVYNLKKTSLSILICLMVLLKIKYFVQQCC